MTEIVNIKKQTKANAFKWCARGSIFGNPFEVNRDGTRKEVIEKYQKWFNFCLKDNVFRSELLKLKNCKIGCFCDYPNEDCHLRIIKEYLDNN